MTNTLRYLALVATLALLAFALGNRQPVRASSNVAQCEAVAQTPNLTVYLCEPEGAPRFLINSYGFMTLLN